MLRIVFYILITGNVVKAQTDWDYWESSEPSYVSIQNNSAVTKPSGFSDNLVTGAKTLYSFLISDLDGDNCPFHPTCSEFLVESVRKTNFIKSALMFTDRFTRDINLGKGTGQYLFSDDGHYLDPVDNYLLDHTKIRHIPLHTE